MNLYAFQPKGHGPSSYFVMAKDEASAKEVVRNCINPDFLNEESYYEIRTLGENEIIQNDND